MTAEIIPLPTTADEPMIWTCNCGSQNFRLYADGLTECSLCDHHDAEQRGNWHEQVTPDPDAERPEYSRAITDHGTADFARASVLASAKELDVCTIAVLWPDGKSRAWSTINRRSTPEEQETLRQLLANLEDLLLGSTRPRPT